MFILGRGGGIRDARRAVRSGLRAKVRKQQHVADAVAVGEQHHQAIDADALSFAPEGVRGPGIEALEPLHGFEAMWFA